VPDGLVRKASRSVLPPPALVPERADRRRDAPAGTADVQGHESFRTILAVGCPRWADPIRREGERGNGPQRQEEYS
jgi:hypothetical protein